MGYSILVNDEIDEITIVEGKCDEEDTYIKTYPEEKIPYGEKAALISVRWSEISVELYDSENLAHIQMEEEMREDLKKYHDDIDCFAVSDYTANIYFYNEAGFTWRIVKEEDFKSETISVLITYLPSGFKTLRFGSRESAKEELFKRLKKRTGSLKSLSPTCASAEIDGIFYLAGCGADFFTKDKLIVYFDKDIEGIEYDSPDKDTGIWIDVPHAVYTRKELLGDALITIDEII